MLRRLAPLLLATLALSLALPARAEETDAADAGAAPDLDGARKAVVAYLDAVKAKKWEDAKKTLHPKTLEAIADQKKRTRKEDHPLAPWARVKESYLTNVEVGEARASANGAAVVPTTEEIFSVEDQGTEEGVRVEYLVLPLGGTWWVTDRRLGEGVFADATLEASYEGWFEGQYELPKAAPAKAKGSKKGK